MTPVLSRGRLAPPSEAVSYGHVITSLFLQASSCRCLLGSRRVEGRLRRRNSQWAALSGSCVNWRWLEGGLGLAGVDWGDLLSAPELSGPILFKSLSASWEWFVHKSALIKKVLLVKRLIEQGQNPGPAQRGHMASWADWSVQAYNSRSPRDSPQPGRKKGG